MYTTSDSTQVSGDKPLSSYTLKRYPWRPYVTPFEEIIGKKYPGSGTNEDPYIIDWLPNDKEDPQQWPGTYKWFTIFIASMMTLAVALSSSAYSGGVVSLTEDFGSSRELLIAGISLFVLGFAFGPLLWAPLSELYGRRWIYIISYALLTLWSGAAAGAPNIGSLLVFRFFAGFFGSSPLANAGGTISDVLDANQRGLGMALFAAAPFLGPALGPITGGFLGLTSGWRWIEGFLTILSGVLFIVGIVFASETYAPIILRRRAKRLSKVTGNVYRFRADAKKPLNAMALFKGSLIRPWKFLFLEPIVAILSIYVALLYGILYLFFAAYPIIFQEGRGWNTGVGGLAFLGVLVGTIVSVVVSVFVVNPQYVKVANKKGGRADPEDRLPPALWGGILIVIGLAGTAATDGPNVHWIAPIIFGAPFGCGIIIVFLSIMGYLVDSYTIYAASVLAANSVLRSLFGAAFPLFTTQMFDKLGLHWGVALPGFLSLACVPATWVFYKYGAGIRAKCKYSADAERQMAMIMSARMAQSKQEDEEARAEGKEVVYPARSRPEGDESQDVQPAEQTGGLGRSQSKRSQHSANASRSTNGAPLGRVSTHLHHEWTVYEALASRDENDLEDDERIRLEGLRRKFGDQSKVDK
ncbi:multiple drug resistance protein [Cryptococcus neoformans c45]|nr:multiple drug resistance protein [Cryptococcus neoformans var. grubii c45]